MPGLQLGRDRCNHRETGSTADAVATDHCHGVARTIRVETEDVTLSGIAADPAGPPRGLLVAMHGGGSRAAYFDSPVARESSLVEVAAAAGWRSVALDRPGYGESAWLHERRLDTAAQAWLLRGAVGQLGEGLPVVLVGHSVGAIVALQLTRLLEREPGSIRLLGTAVGGAPLVYTREQQAMHAAVDASGPTIRRPPGTRPDPEEWLGPTGTYPEQLRERRHEVLAKVPSGEMADAAGAPELLSALLADVQLPIQFAVAEYESTMASAEQLLARALEVLPQVPGSELLTVHGSGHNLSLSHRARSYHLRVLSFAEQALAASTCSRLSDEGALWAGPATWRSKCEQ